MTIPGKYAKQPVSRVGKDYQGTLLGPILTEMDRELRRLRDIVGDGSAASAASDNEPYVTIGNSSGLSMERALAVGTALTLTDAGANSTATIGLDQDLIELAAIANVRGDLIVTDSTPTWVRLGIGTANQVLGVHATLADPEYKSILGTADEINIAHAAGSITIGIVDPLIVTKGGTGLAAGTSGGIPYFSSTTTIASSALLAANQLMLGGGAATTPATLGSLGTTTTVLHGNAAGAPTFAAVSLTADVSGDLPFSSLAQGAARSVLGVAGNATADVASIQGTADQTLVVNSAGTALAFGALNLAAAAAITGDLPFANLTQGSARSVLGVAGNATADFASIQGTTAHDFFKVNSAGTGIGFEALTAAMLPAHTHASSSQGGDALTPNTIVITQGASAYNPIILTDRAGAAGDATDALIKVIDGDSGFVTFLLGGGYFTAFGNVASGLPSVSFSNGLQFSYLEGSSDGLLQWVDTSASPNIITLTNPLTLSGNRTIRLPDATGTPILWSTGTTQPVAGALLYGAGANTAMSALAIGASGTILTSTGSAPQWSTNAAVVDIARSWTTLQTFADNTLKIVGSADATKTLVFEMDGATAGADLVVKYNSTADRDLIWSLAGTAGFDLTLAWTGTADRTVTIPNATTTLAGLAVTETFTAKQTFSTAASSTAQIKLNSTDSGFGADVFANPTATRSINIPDADGNLAVTAAAQGTTTITTTSIITAPITGNYIINYTLECTTADVTAGSIAITFAWTDGAGAATKVSSSRVLTATGRLTDNTAFSVRPTSGNITYAVALTGIQGSAAFAYGISVVQVPF